MAIVNSERPKRKRKLSWETLSRRQISATYALLARFRGRIEKWLQLKRLEWSHPSPPGAPTFLIEINDTFFVIAYNFYPLWSWSPLEQSRAQHRIANGNEPFASGRSSAQHRAASAIRFKEGRAHFFPVPWTWGKREREKCFLRRWKMSARAAAAAVFYLRRRAADGKMIRAEADLFWILLMWSEMDALHALRCISIIFSARCQDEREACRLPTPLLTGASQT